MLPILQHFCNPVPSGFQIQGAVVMEENQLFSIYEIISQILRQQLCTEVLAAARQVRKRIAATLPDFPEIFANPIDFCGNIHCEIQILGNSAEAV